METEDTISFTADKAPLENVALLSGQMMMLHI
jgi:hypothetical protein